MYRQDTILKLKPILEERLEKNGYVVVYLRFYQASGELKLEILVDRLQGGITLDECARLSRELRELIENSGLIFEAYALEVSSPGLDRPLTTPKDFKRVGASEVRIFLKAAVEGKIEYLGFVEKVSEDALVLKTKDKTIELPFDKVNKAKRVIL